ncbi:hypothetical protein FA743_13560 [Paracoccus gahaiensis]|uniref:YhaN AAA domain-containing protein n=1 Tax=Paracoccus gahaiensis TaxID=1706839 RepID=A0A4V5MV55_9RHOB|nr:YhaN family protein [Paracoccus gahaiensis]TJZ90928.1 hypothetical protein FA743_13560 [Paracoccus gahaiensis]
MRIRQLSLERFGHFTDRSFDFGSGGARADFHIIYGANEAGKTTTMEAALRLFYGFPLREDYAFKHARSNLQVSATLEIGGTLRRFTRLPKRAGSLVDEAGTALPETALSAHLAGLSQDDYRRLLCLDDETIERGGEEIATAQGDIGRLLFSAAAGVADLSGVLDGVRDQADALWKRRSRSTRMAELKRDLAEVERQIKERDVTASAWKALKKDLIKAQEAEQGARAARNALNSDRARIEGQKRALPLMAEIAALHDAIAPWSDYPAQLDFDPERLIVLRSDRGIAAQTVDRLTDALTALAEQRDRLPVEPALDALATALDDLEDLSARDRGAHLDLERRQDDQRSSEAAMIAAVRDLGVASAGVDPRSLVLPAGAITALEGARDALRAAMAQAEAEARETDDLQDRARAAAEAVEDGPAQPQDAPRIADILLRFDAEDLAPRHAAALQAIDAARAKADRALAGLAQGPFRLDHLPEHPPSRVQATEWAEGHDALQSELRTATTRRDDHRADRAARHAQAEALIRGAHLVSDDEAEALRAARDALWAAHLAALDPPTAAVFHEALRRHDAATDARLGRASDLGQLRQIQQAAAEAEAHVAQADEKITALQARIARIEEAVGQAARQVGFPEALSPPDWLAWVVRHDQARDDALTLREAREVNRSVLERGDALRAELAARLPFDPVDLASTLAAARAVADKDRRQAEAQAKADEALRQIQRELARRRKRLAGARDAEGLARAAWQQLVAAHLGDLVSPDILMGTLEPLRVLREHEAARAAAEQRVTAMQADQARFAQEVAALARTHALEVQPTAAQTFAALKTLADQARRARDAARKLSEDIEAASAERARNQDRLRQIDQEVAAIAAVFPDAAGLTDIDGLRQIAARAQQVIADRATLALRQRSLLLELGAPDIATAREHLAERSVADVEAALEGNRSDLDHAEDRLTGAIRDRTTAEHALSQVKGDGEIAALVERRATLELQLEEAALQHLELSLGHSLASDAIRRYRDSHRSGMMTATEQCFATLTQGAYPSLTTQIEKDAEILLAVDRTGASKRAAEMSKGTRFQLYLALRAAAHEQLVAQGTTLPFFCDDIFETFDEDRTSAACRVMEAIGGRGQAIYLTHHRHVVDIAMRVCRVRPVLHEL